MAAPHTHERTRWPEGMCMATAAEYLDMSVAELRLLIHDGFLSVQPGGIVLKKDLDNLLDGRKNTTTRKASIFIYFIQMRPPRGPIKIGQAINVEQRLCALQTASPYELKLLLKRAGTSAEEEGIHLRFDKLRIRGEWFKWSPALIRFIEGGGI